MKTQIALLVTVITSILFWGGCASTPQTYQIENVEEKNGVYHLKNTDKPVTGRIVRMVMGRLQWERFVKDGLLHGRYRSWHEEHLDYPATDAVYENGEPIRLKKYWFEPAASLGASTANDFQRTVPGWNQDGTPKDPEK